MDAVRDSLVAGLFGSQRQADAALDGLHRIGVSDEEVEVGAPEPGRYRIEYHESANVWTGVRNGMVVGAMIGSLIALGIMTFAMPGLSLVGLIELSVPMGAFWGIFFGGLTGMAMKAAVHADGEPRCAITPKSSEVLVVVHAGDRIGAAHEALERQHPRYFLTDVPAVHRGQPHLAATA